MASLYFTDSVIQKNLTAIYQRYHLKPLYLMSTSGNFVVIQAQNKNKRKFIIKLRKKKSQDARRQFIKEAAFFQFLIKARLKNSYLPDKLIVQTKKQPEFIIYSYINSYPLNGYYFYIGRRRKAEFYQTNLGAYLSELQSLTPHFLKQHPEVKLPVLKFKQLFKQFEEEQKKCRHLSDKLIRQVKKILWQEKNSFDQAPLVLTHADFNPKNILIKNGLISLIDWSDLSLTNPLYDLALLSLALWEDPELATNWKYQNLSALNADINKQKLFLLNQLIIIPRFINIIDDSIVGLKDDLRNGLINRQTFDKIHSIALSARRATLQKLKHLISTYQENFTPCPINRQIENFSSHRYVQKFIKQKQKELKIKHPTLKQIKIIKRDFLQISKRLIAEYKLPYQTLIAKIKIERGDDLGWQSWVVFSAINNYHRSRGLAPRPLAYFANHHLLIYQKKQGVILSDLNKAKLKIPPTSLGEKIATATFKLHCLPLNRLKQIKLLSNYNTAEQILFLKRHQQKFPHLSKLKLTTLAQQLEKIYQSLPQTKPVFIHGDLQPQNIIISHRLSAGFIDFDNGLFDDPLADVGNFIIQASSIHLTAPQTNKLRLSFWQQYQKLAKLPSHKELWLRLNFYLIMGLVKNLNFHIYLQQFHLLPADLTKIRQILKNKNKPLEKIINLIDNL